MKEIFNDESYIEIVKSQEPNKLLISLAARDHNNPDMVTMISVEIDKDKLIEMMEAV